MKYKNLVLFLICTVFISESYSQVKNCFCKQIDFDFPVYEAPLQGKTFHNKYPKQDEQFYNNWTKADIYLVDNSIIENKTLRYNALIDEFLWNRERDFQTIILNRKNIARIHFHTNYENNRIDFIKINYKNNQYPNYGDMFVLLLSNAEGKVQLLKKAEVVENTNTSHLEKNEIYYLFINGEYKRLRLGNLFLYKTFENEKKQIKQVVKNNKLSVKKEQDLIKAINIYNKRGSVEE